MNFFQINYVPYHSNVLLDLCFSNAHSAVNKKTVVSQLLCDNHYPSVSFKYKAPTPITMIEDKHSFHDFNNADYIQIAT